MASHSSIMSSHSSINHDFTFFHFPDWFHIWEGVRHLPDEVSTQGGPCRYVLARALWGHHHWAEWAAHPEGLEEKVAREGAEGLQHEHKAQERTSGKLSGWVEGDSCGVWKDVSRVPESFNFWVYLYTHSPGEFVFEMVGRASFHFTTHHWHSHELIVSDMPYRLSVMGEHNELELTGYVYGSDRLSYDHAFGAEAVTWPCTRYAWCKTNLLLVIFVRRM